jgi:hypothetical protein
MMNKHFWRLLAIAVAAFVGFCLLSVALAPELAILVLLAHIGGQVLRRLDSLGKQLG